MAVERVFREHVIKYITSHPGQFALGWLHAELSLWMPEIKLDIDIDGDLVRLQRFCSSLAEANAPYWTAREIIFNVQKAIEI